MATDEELNKMGALIDDEADVNVPATPVQAPVAEQAEEPEPAQDNAAIEAPEVAEQVQEEASANEENEVQAAPKPGRAAKRISQLTGKLKSSQEREAFLEAELKRAKTLLPQGMEQAQPVNVQPSVASDPDTAWRNLSESALQAIIASDDAEVTSVHRQKAAAYLTEKTAERVVQRHLAPTLQRERQAPYTQRAMQEYPELFVEGSVENQLFRQTYATDPRFAMVDDGMLIAAEKTVARLSRTAMPALRQQNDDAKKQLRRAKANAALGSGSPAPVGGGASRARAVEMSTDMNKKGYDWKRSDAIINKVNDML